MVEREPAFRWVMRQQLDIIAARVSVSQETAILMDLGANEGDYSILMSEHMESVPHKIIAVEPDENNFARLKNNLEFHEIPAEIINCAVGDTDKASIFYAASKNNLGSLIERKGVAQYPKRVQVRPLEYFDKFGTPDFIKMDIEGGEVKVLQGAREYLKRHNPCILMEVHPYLYHDSFSLKKELEWLFDHGWLCTYMISAAMPEHYQGFIGIAAIQSFEVKPRWKRIVYYLPDPKMVYKYACQLDWIGVPDWKGGINRKVMRALCLEKT